MTVAGSSRPRQQHLQAFHSGLRPAYEAALEFLHIQPRKQNSQLIVTRCSVLKRQETAQELKLLLTI